MQCITSDITHKFIYALEFFFPLLLFLFVVSSNSFTNQPRLAAVTHSHWNTLADRGTETRILNHTVIDSYRYYRHTPVKMSTLEDIIGDTSKFLSTVVTSCEAMGIDIKGHQIDHLCYRCSSKDEYLDICQKITSLGIGALLVEGMIGGRPISTFDLNEPLSFLAWSIPSLEVASPKPGDATRSCLVYTVQYTS